MPVKQVVFNNQFLGHALIPLHNGGLSSGGQVRHVGVNGCLGVSGQKFGEFRKRINHLWPLPHGDFVTDRSSTTYTVLHSRRYIVEFDLFNEIVTVHLCVCIPDTFLC